MIFFDQLSYLFIFLVYNTLFMMKPFIIVCTFDIKYFTHK